MSFLRISALLLLTDFCNAEPIEVGNETQLFVDDYVIESLTGATCAVVPCTKHPANPVLKPELPWEGEHVLPVSALFDAKNERYRLWYRPDGAKFQLAHAESPDGVAWEKSQLDLKAGSAWNGVLDDIRETDPARRFKLLSWGPASRGNGLYLYVSPDGLNWTAHSKEPLLEDLADVHTLMGWDPSIERYVAFVRPHKPIRTIARTTSPDMIHWTEPETILEPDEADPPGTHLYGMSVLRDRGVYFGLLWVYHPNQLMVDVQLAFSRDGVAWERAGRRHPILSYGLPDQFDSHILMALQPVVVGDEMKIYYLAKDRPHPIVYATEVQPTPPDPIPPKNEQTWLEGRRSCVGLATTRRDRFVAVSAPAVGGEILTKPFRLEGQQLLINANASRGDLRVELRDENGKPIPKFAMNDADAIRGDSTEHIVSWRGISDFEKHEGKIVQLRIKIRNAQLFSFRVADE